MEKKQKKSVYVHWILMRLAMILYDIAAVNLAYFMALVIRFYVGNEFHEATLIYIPAFQEIAPWYTLCCIGIFAVLKLYTNQWKFASLNDMNRIIAASLLTTVAQMVCSLVVALPMDITRMPFSYYIIGAFLQFCLIAGSRFSYQFVQLELRRLRKRLRSASANVMIVGVGETSSMVRRQLERDEDNTARPVCLLDFRGHELGSMQEGLPIVKGMDNLEAGIKKYGVSWVILADTTMPADIRQEIRIVCEANNIGVQDFSGSLNDGHGALTLRNLMTYTSGNVELVVGEKRRCFSNGEETLHSVTKQYVIKSVFAADNRLVVELQPDILVQNDITEEWVQDYEKETGNDISFF